jgi:hypothetical protein
MSRDSRLTDKKPPSDNNRQWLSGMIVIVATIVSFVGFARISVGWTLAISSAIFVALAYFLWRVGGEE